MLGELYAASGDYDEAERTLCRSGAGAGARPATTSGVANALRELGMSHLFRGELNEADALRSPKRSPRTATKATDAARRGRCRTSPGSRSPRGDVAAPPSSGCRRVAELFGELGDWGGLGWAFGLLAFVRYIRAASTKPPSSPSRSRSKASRPATAGPSA